VPFSVYISSNYCNQNLVFCNPKHQAQWLKIKLLKII
jgi:hypothetical protein